MNQNDFKYWAFISYSHQDKVWGQWLHKALETYRVPRRLVGRPLPDDQSIPRRILPVFRDREELPTATNLGDVINEALAQSRCLIVICSPRSAASQWVNEEILAYKRSGRGDRILALIVDGEPNAIDKPEVDDDLECFPHALRYEWDGDANALSDRRTEPIAADARPDKDGKINTKLKLIAGVLSVGFDDLKQRELQRRQQRLITITAIASALVLILAGLSFWALAEKRHAESQQLLAEQRQKDAEQSAYQANVGLTFVAYRDGHFAIAKNRLDKCLPYLRNWEWGFLWKALNRKLKSFEEPEGATAIAVFNNGGHFVIAGKSEIAVFERETSRIVKRLPTKQCQTLAVSSDGTFVIAVESQGRLLTRRKLPSLEIETSAEILGLQTTPVALNPGGTTIAVGSLDTGVELRDARTLAIVPTPKGPFAEVTCLRFNQDGTQLLVGGREHVSMRDAKTLKALQTFKYTGRVADVAFGHEEKMILVAGDRPFVDTWSGDNFDRRQQIPAFAKSQNAKHLRIRSLEIAGHRLFTGSSSGIVRIADLITGEDLALFKGHAFFALHDEELITPAGIFSAETVTSLYGHDGFVSEVATNPAGNLLASGSGDGTVRLWDLKTNRTARELKHDSDVQTIRFNAVGTKLFSSTERGTVYAWDVKTGEMLQSRQIATRGVFALDLSPDDKHVFVAAEGKLIQLDSANLDEQASINLQAKRTYAIRLAPTNTALAVGDGDRLLLLDPHTLQTAYEFTMDAGAILDIAWHESGTLLAAATEDGVIEMWDVKTQQSLRRFTGHTGAVYAIAFSHIPSRLISAGEDGQVRIWDIDTHQELAALRGHPGGVTSIAIWASNIITADDMGVIRIWPGMSTKAIQQVSTQPTTSQ